MGLYVWNERFHINTTRNVGTHDNLWHQTLAINVVNGKLKLSILNCVTGIGNGSHELSSQYMHTRTIIVGSAFWTFQTGKQVFKKNRAPGILLGISTLIYYSFCLILWNNFKKELGYNNLLTYINKAEYGLIFTLWASRALAYNGRNFWIVDLCSIDLCWWNWRGVGKAINFNVLLQGGFNFFIQVSLWAQITSLGCRRPTFLRYDRLVIFYCGTGCYDLLHLFLVWEMQAQSQVLWLL